MSDTRSSSIRRIGMGRTLNRMFLGLLALCLGALGLVIYKELTSATDPLNYFVIGAVIFYSLVALLLEPDKKVNAFLLLISTVIALYLSEIMARILPAMITTSEYVYSEGFDTRDRLQVVRDFRSQGRSVFPSFHPYALDKELPQDFAGIYPLAGLPEAECVLCNESGQWVIIKTDRLGFNNPDTVHELEKVRVAVLGDSFVQGNCVAEDRNLVSRIAEEIPETVNFGNGGNGPLANYATFVEYVARLQPDIVIWVHFENDVGDLRDEMGRQDLLRYLQDGYSQNLVSKNDQLRRRISAYVEREYAAQLANLERESGEPASAESTNYDLGSVIGSIRGFIVLDYVRQIVRAYAFGSESPGASGFDEELALYGTILTKFRRDVSTWGGRAYFVFLPSSFRLRKEDSLLGFVARLPSHYMYKEVLEVARQSGLDIIDMLPVMASAGDPASFFPNEVPSTFTGGEALPFHLNNRHYNAKGYGLVGDTILGTITTDSDP